MPGAIEDLQAAGFSDQEVNTWAQEKRETLSAAGFQGNEIDSYFTGGVTAPDRVPDAVLKRVADKSLLSDIGDFAQHGLETILKNEPDKEVGDAVEAFALKNGMSPEQAKQQRQTIESRMQRGNVLSLAGPLEVLGSPILGAYRHFVSRPLEEAGGPPKEVTEGLTMIGAAAAGIGRGMLRKPTGEPIGTLPESSDFVNAATAVGSDKMPVQEKMLQLYEERGILPAEAAEAAQSDPVVQQKLLSSEPLDMPGSTPPTAPKGPPPDPGAFPDIWKFDTSDAYNAAVREWKRLDHDRYTWERQYRSFEGTLPEFQDTRGQGQQYHGSPNADLKVDQWHYGSKNFYGNGFYTTDAADIAHGYTKRKGSAGEGGFYSVTPKEGVKVFNMEEPVPNWITAGLDDKFTMDNFVLAVADGEYGKKPANVRELYDEIRANSREEGLTADDVQEIFEGFKEKVEAHGFSAMEHTGGLQTNNRAHRVVIYFDPAQLDIVKTDRNGLRLAVGNAAGGGAEPPPPSASAQGPTRGGGRSEPPEPPKPPEPGSFDEAQRKILDKISVGEREPGKLTISKLYTEAVDNLHPLKGVSEDAYQIARLTRGQFGKAEHFLEHGTFDFDTYRTTGKGLRDILDPVKDDLDGFRAYLASKRALEVEATGRTSGFDTAAAQEVISNGEGRFGKAATEIVDYQNSLIKYLKDSGVLSDRAYDAMVEANKSYVPFYRVFFPGEGPPGTKGFGPGNPIKALKGSDRGIIDPLESVIKNTYAYVSIAERNAAGIKIIDALKQEGFRSNAKTPKFLEGAETELMDYLKQRGVAEPEALVDFIKTAGADEGTTISAWRNGKREGVETNDAELVRAFRQLDQESVNMVTKVLAVPARALRAGAVLTPDFAARNLIRDFITSFINSKGLFSPIDTAKGLASAIKKDADFQNWLKAGGANSTMVALDRAYMQESLASLDKQTGLMSRAWNVTKNPLNVLRMTSELIENATRLGEFKKVAAGSVEKGDLQKAAFASREVTLDFARIGASMRAYNMITAFANAQIQGVDRLGRAFADRPVNTTAKIAAGITLPSVLLWFANHDDPRYQELPDWQKDLFWIVMTKDHIFRIPKPFEIGIVFGSGVERALEATIGQSKEAFRGFANSVIGAFTPSVVPTGLLPMVEQFANRSSFTDRTLIPADVERQLPEYQYTPYTTELSKALGQMIAAFPGVRDASVDKGAVGGAAARALTTPILIENYVRAWTGGLGTYMMQATDYTLRKAGVLPDPITPSPTLADVPFVKAFAVRYPSATTESVQRFYDDYEKNKRYYDTWMAKAKEGDQAAVERVQDAGGPAMFTQLDGIKQTLAEHSKLIKDIYKTPDMPADEKRQLIDGLYYAMIQVAQQGRESMKIAGEKFPPQ